MNFRTNIPRRSIRLWSASLSATLLFSLTACIEVPITPGFVNPDGMLPQLDPSDFDAATDVMLDGRPELLTNPEPDTEPEFPASDTSVSAPPNLDQMPSMDSSGDSGLDIMAGPEDGGCPDQRLLRRIECQQMAGALGQCFEWAYGELFLFQGEISAVFAHDLCRQGGGALLSLDTTCRQQALQQFDAASGRRIGQIHIGLHDGRLGGPNLAGLEDGQWRWVNRQPLIDELALWSEGEPAPAAAGRCVRAGQGDLSEWAVSACNSTSGFICEFP